MPEHETTHFHLPYPGNTGKVKDGAIDFQELATKTDEVLFERLLTLSEHGTSVSAKSGELIKATGAITVTLPTPATNATVGVLANNHAVEITAGAAKIYGEPIAGVSTASISLYQHVVLQSDGTNWYVVAGNTNGNPEVKTVGGAISNQEYEPSAKYTSFVTVKAETNPITSVFASSAHIISGEQTHLPAGATVSFPLRAGQRFLATVESGGSYAFTYWILPFAQ